MMTLDSHRTHLSSLLDDLWHRPDERISLAEQLVADLNKADWLVLAGWDTAATFGPVSGKLHLVQPRNIQITDSWGKVFLMAFLVETNKLTDPSCLITYRGTDFGVAIDESSPNVPMAQVIHEPKSLLTALQFIREHLDSVLLKPKDMRDSEIAQFVASSGLEDDHFRRLAVWFSAVEVYL